MMSQNGTGAAQPGTDSSATRRLPSKWDNRTTFTIDEAAEILGVSRGTAYAAAAGTLPVIRFGRRQVVPRAPFERLLGF